MCNGAKLSSLFVLHPLLNPGIKIVPEENQNCARRQLAVPSKHLLLTALGDGLRSLLGEFSYARLSPKSLTNRERPGGGMHCV